MRLRQIVVLVIFILLLLLVSAFKYTVEIDRYSGDRTVSYGVTNIYSVTYHDKAVNTEVSNPYEGIPTGKAVASYKTGAVIIIIAIGFVLYMVLA